MKAIKFMMDIAFLSNLDVSFGIILAYLILTVLLAFSRSIYRLIGPDPIETDRFEHLVQAREFKQSDLRVPEKISQSMYDMSFANPYLLPLTLAAVPQRWWPIIDRYFSALMDVAFFLLILGVSSLGLLEDVELFLAALFLLLTPQLMRRDLSHGIGLSARKPGLLITTLALFFFSLWVLRGEAAYLVLSVSFGSLILIASRFSLQAFVFICVGIGILSEPIAIALIPAAIISSIIISRGFAWTILRSHFRFLYDYAMRKQYVKLYDGWKSLDTARRFLRAQSLRHILKTIHESVLVIGLLNNPFVVAALVGLLLATLEGSGTGVPWIFVAWTLSGVAAFFITSLYHFRFLGQPSRYLEYTYLPTVMIVSKYYIHSSFEYRLAVWIMLGIGLIMIFGYIWVHLRFYESDISSESEEAVRFLSTLKPSVVVTQPRHYGAWIAWETDHRVTDYLGNRFTSSDSREQFQKLYPGRATYVTDDVDWLRNELNPDFVFFQTSNQFQEGELSPPDKEPIFSNEEYEIYRFEKLE